MRIVSFNVNGIRTRLHQLQAVVETHAPEIAGLQETRVADAAFPQAEIRQLGYESLAHGEKSHYGVALLSKSRAVRVTRGLPSDAAHAQRRAIDAVYTLPNGNALRVISAYFPQGENRSHPDKFPAKEKFYADLLACLQSTASPDEHLVLMGDFNVAPLDLDVGIGADNARRWLRTGKTGFLPEERAWLQRLVDWGLVDSFRQVHAGRDDRFSWFDYRSRGFEREPRRGMRIDHILVSRALAAHVTDAGIDYDIRAMPRPSDHCPVWVDLAVD